MIRLTAGIVLLVLLLSFVGKATFLGVECHYIAGLGPGCIHSLIVYALYAVALLLVGFGLLKGAGKKGIKNRG